MSPTVKAALIGEIGGLVYLVCWVVAMQSLYTYLMGVPEKGWLVRAWRWWEERHEREFERVVIVLQRPAGEEPRPAVEGE